MCNTEITFMLNSYRFSSCLNKSAAPVPCESGSYSPFEVMVCKKCPPGHMCPNAKSSIPCMNGTYSNGTASTDCKICPAGYSCLDPREQPVACSEGFYSPSGIPQCLACPAGHR